MRIALRGLTHHQGLVDHPSVGDRALEEQRVKRMFVWVAAVIALAGCTTVEDFRKMSAQDRALLVCNRDPEVLRLRESRQSHTDGIRSAQEALGRGYRIHRQCRTVDVPTGSRTLCEKRGEQTLCREEKTTRKEERCNETPVPIHPDNERRNIAEWTDAGARLDRQSQDAFEQCYDRVFHMTPEQAYQRY